MRGDFLLDHQAGNGGEFLELSFPSSRRCIVTGRAR